MHGTVSLCGERLLQFGFVVTVNPSGKVPLHSFWKIFDVAPSKRIKTSFLELSSGTKNYPSENFQFFQFHFVLFCSHAIVSPIKVHKILQRNN